MRSLGPLGPLGPQAKLSVHNAQIEESTKEPPRLAGCNGELAKLAKLAVGYGPHQIERTHQVQFVANQTCTQRPEI